MSSQEAHKIDYEDPFAPFRTTAPNAELRVWYEAGCREPDPHKPDLCKNYTSDGVFTGIIASDPEVLASQLEVSAYYQGKTFNWVTGERPGKIHHEIDDTPGVFGVNGRMELATTYNRGDTTGLFLIGAEGLLLMNPAEGERFMKKHGQGVRAAAEYIVASVGDDNLFWDAPPKGASQYALMVPYWKDTQLPHEDGKKEPKYPVSFAHAHFVNARGLLSAGTLLNDQSYVDLAYKMFESGIQTFIREDGFTIYIDGEGRLDLPSTDEPQILATIPTKLTHKLPVDAICKRAEELFTPFGLSSVPLYIANKLGKEADLGHVNAVWPFEQALIAYACSKHNAELLRLQQSAGYLGRIAAVAAGVVPYIGAGNERLHITEENGVLQQQSIGNSRQLFSVAGLLYFTKPSSYLEKSRWL